jgi:translocation and assembly module TamA
MEASTPPRSGWLLNHSRGVRHATRMLRIVPLWLALGGSAVAQAPPTTATDAAAPAAKQPGVVELELAGLKGEQRSAALSALGIAAYTTRTTIGSARLERLLGEAPDEIRQALEVFGYYAATARVERTALPDRRHRVAITVDLGEPVRIKEATVLVDGPAAAETAIARRLAGFTPGPRDILDHRAYEAGKAGIERSLQRLGYFDAQLVEHRVEVSRATGEASLRLRWTSGERYRFGATRYEDAQFPDRFMQRFRPWADGEAYSQSQVEAMQQRLAAAGYFGGLEIEPQVEERADGKVPVRVKLTPAARSAWTVGVYYETNYGAGLRAGLDQRWLNDRGHSARADLEVARSLQLASVEYRIPHHNLYGATWLAGVGLRNEDADGIDGRSGLLRAGLLGSWQEWTGIASANALRGNFRVGSRLRGDVPRSNATVLYPELSVTRVFARDRIRPTSGGSLRLTARAASTALGSDVDLAQLRAEGRYVMPMGEAGRLLARLELGWTDTDRFERLPPDLRFFAGGDGSVRGYAWRDLGPRDAAGDPLGAPRVLTGSLEYDHVFRPDWSWAVFVDGGDAFYGSSPSPAFGLGGGLRWASPIGPVRLDLAYGLDDEVGGFQLHFSAGPDL